MPLAAEIVVALASAIVGGAFSGVAALAAIRVQLRYMTREIEQMRGDFQRETSALNRAIERAHSRIDWIERPGMGQIIPPVPPMM